MTPERSWLYRAIEATRGNQTRIGCILLAFTNHNARHPPCFGHNAAILSDGTVVSQFRSRDGKLHKAQAVCEVQELVDNFRGLCDHLKLSDADREAMFNQLRGWIVKDFRATPAPLT